MATPLELFKCRAQIETSNVRTSYLHLIKSLYKENGFRSIYRGFWATFWRDVPMFGAFFFIYEYLSKSLINEKESKSSQYMKLIFISGLAGIINWVPTYPFDLVKSKI